MVIELAQKIEDNQRMHLRFTLPIFAPTPQMAAAFFAVQTQNPNEQLINRLTANLVQLLESLAQALQQPSYQRQQNYSLSVCYYCELTEHFSRDCNNDNQNNRTINNNIFNQRPNYANINFFGENLLVEATKKKKTKVDFVLDSNKALTSIADNNKPLKAKVFKNLLKLEPPEIVQKSGSYSVVKDFMETLTHITFGQLIIHLQFRKDFYKLLIPKKKTPKTNKHSHQAELADNSNITPLICKAQVAGYFIDLILDSKSSVSIIAKHFLEAIGRKIDESSTRLMTNVHGNKKKSLGITKAVPV
ncbi:hypothetical protein G9A89_003737 [Geosiphon pyriformis]|nr:hypothetical protein G9A89_003737 [Geosiphon pyriformis]